MSYNKFHNICIILTKVNVKQYAANIVNNDNIIIAILAAGLCDLYSLINRLNAFIMLLFLNSL